MSALDPHTQRRLVSAARLLESDRPGERQAAAEAMIRLLPDGVTVADLIGRALSPTPAPVRVSAERSAWDMRSDPLRPWRNKARIIAAHKEKLAERELEFVLDMAVRRDPPTPRQGEWLDNLAERINSRWAA